MRKESYMGRYSIKDLEKLSRVKAHTIRMWEKRHELLSPSRTGTNIRYYTDDDLRKLLNVSLLNDRGFKISKIARMTDKEISEEVLALESNAEGAADHVESLILAMTELDEQRFEKVMNSCILKLGFENTMLQVIQPFLQRIGVLWLIDAVKPGQEHFISNLIRQKVLAAIDGLVPEVHPKPRTILFFLPEGELHEMGLLFGHFLAKKLGHRSIYLGQNVPFEDLDAIVQHRSPDTLVTGFLSHQNAEGIDRFLRKLHHHFPKVKVLYFHSSRLEGVTPATGQEYVAGLPELREALS